MNVSAISFSLKRDDSGVVRGFSLTANETWAECFCFSFPTAMNKRRADIQFPDGHIVFIHRGVSSDGDGEFEAIYGSSEGGIFEAEITPDDSQAVQDLLYCRGAYVDCRPTVTKEIAWGKGFTLTAKQC